MINPDVCWGCISSHCRVGFKGWMSCIDCGLLIYCPLASSSKKVKNDQYSLLSLISVHKVLSIINCPYKSSHPQPLPRLELKRKLCYKCLNSQNIPRVIPPSIWKQSFMRGVIYDCCVRPQTYYSTDLKYNSNCPYVLEHLMRNQTINQNANV